MEVIFSCDDGATEDYKVAKILEEYGLKGVFYVAPFYCKIGFTPIKLAALKEIAEKHEIGGHTLRHKVLTRYGNEFSTKEIIDGKNVLEKELGVKVTKFAYPRGWYNKRIMKLVKDCGFKEARTMKLGVTNIKGYDKFELPATAHIYPRQEYKEEGIVNSITDLYDKAKKENGYFNLCMHGWELQKFKTWGDFKAILKYIKNTR